MVPPRSPLLQNADWRGAGAVERGGLENRWACKRLVGSNPTPAARLLGEKLEDVVELVARRAPQEGAPGACDRAAAKVTRVLERLAARPAADDARVRLR